MELVNEITAAEPAISPEMQFPARCSLRCCFVTSVLLLAPFAPYLACELWPSNLATGEFAATSPLAEIRRSPGPRRRNRNSGPGERKAARRGPRACRTPTRGTMRQGRESGSQGAGSDRRQTDRQGHRRARQAGQHRREGMMTAKATVRGTQSLVHTLRRMLVAPSLLALEVRMALALRSACRSCCCITRASASCGHRHQARSCGIQHFPCRTRCAPPSVDRASTSPFCWPPVHAHRLWVVPLLAIGWAIVSGIGRNAVLRRYDPELPMKSVTAHCCCNCCASLAWAELCLDGFSPFSGLRATRLSGAEPNLVALLCLVICLSLGIFMLWALLSWIFSIAPLLALLEDRGVAGQPAIAACAWAR